MKSSRLLLIANLCLAIFSVSTLLNGLGSSMPCFNRRVLTLLMSNLSALCPTTISASSSRLASARLHALSSRTSSPSRQLALVIISSLSNHLAAQHRIDQSCISCSWLMSFFHIDQTYASIGAVSISKTRTRLVRLASSHCSLRYLR